MKVRRVVIKCKVCGKPFSILEAEAERLEELPTVCNACLRQVEEYERREQFRKDKTFLTCESCGKEFYISNKRVAELEAKGLPLYKVCFACKGGEKK